MPYDVLFTISFICALAVAFMGGFTFALAGVQKARAKTIDDALALVSKLFGGNKNEKSTVRAGGDTGGTGGDQASRGSTDLPSTTDDTTGTIAA